MPAEDALLALVTKERHIRAKQERCSEDRSFLKYKYTVSAKKILNDIDWAITRIMAAEKKVAKEKARP